MGLFSWQNLVLILEPLLIHIKNGMKGEVLGLPSQIPLKNCSGQAYYFDFIMVWFDFIAPPPERRRKNSPFLIPSKNCGSHLRLKGYGAPRRGYFRILNKLTVRVSIVAMCKDGYGPPYPRGGKYWIYQTRTLSLGLLGLRVDCDAQESTMSE